MLDVDLHRAFADCQFARAGGPKVMLALASWARSIVTFQPDSEAIAGVGTLFKIYLFFGMTVFLIFPFTRLVHIWSIPFGSVFRASRIVRRKGPAVRGAEGQPGTGRAGVRLISGKSGKLAG